MTTLFRDRPMTRRDAPVNVPKELQKKIKFVADYNEQSVVDYLDHVLGPIVDQHYEAAIRKIAAQIDAEKKKAK